MEYKIDDIVQLLVKENYLSTINGEFLRHNLDKINVREQSIVALRENLTISLDVGKLSPRNIRDFKSLLKAVENVKDENILVVNVKHQGDRNIYIDNSIKTIFDEL